MARSLTPSERIELYFRECSTEDAIRELDRINLILRTRKVLDKPVRGRPRKKKEPPPLAAKEASS